MFQPWPNKYNKVTMDKYCFILFFINTKYFDNIWYNTVVMSMYYLEKKKEKKKKGRIKKNVKSLYNMCKGIWWNKSLIISSISIKINNTVVMSMY
jgi:hypothetical protein